MNAQATCRCWRCWIPSVTNSNSFPQVLPSAVTCLYMPTVQSCFWLLCPYHVALCQNYWLYNWTYNVCYNMPWIKTLAIKMEEYQVYIKSTLTPPPATYSLLLTTVWWSHLSRAPAPNPSSSPVWPPNGGINSPPPSGTLTVSPPSRKGSRRTCSGSTTVLRNDFLDLMLVSSRNTMTLALVG